MFFLMKELLYNHCCAGTYLLVCDAGGGDNPGGTDGSLLCHWGGPGYSPPVLIPQEQGAQRSAALPAQQACLTRTQWHAAYLYESKGKSEG